MADEFADSLTAFRIPQFDHLVRVSGASGNHIRHGRNGQGSDTFRMSDKLAELVAGVSLVNGHLAVAPANGDAIAWSEKTQTSAVNGAASPFLGDRNGTPII